MRSGAGVGQSAYHGRRPLFRIYHTRHEHAGAQECAVLAWWQDGAAPQYSCDVEPVALPSGSSAMRAPGGHHLSDAGQHSF